MITQRDYPQALQAVSNAYDQSEKAKQDEALAKLKNYFAIQAEEREPDVAGKKQEKVNQANLQTLLNPKLQDQVNQGGSIKAGDIAIGADPTLKLAAKGPQQAGSFNKVAETTYKPINDQLNASKDTLDALNQKNSASDKLALINEARLAAGAGGSRAIKGIMDSLSGGKTANMEFQEAVNFLNNTPNLPTMSDAQRDAIRESVFNRLSHLEQQHQQAQAKLSGLGPVLAPQSDTGTIIKSYATPAQTNLESLKKMQNEYNAKRQGAPNSISSPSSADQAPSNVDRLKDFFGFGAKPQAQAAPAQAQPDHAAAAVWASDPKNANDPRAQKILQILQSTGGQ